MQHTRMQDGFAQQRREYRGSIMARCRPPSARIASARLVTVLVCLAVVQRSMGLRWREYVFCILYSVPLAWLRAWLRCYFECYSASTGTGTGTSRFLPPTHAAGLFCDLSNLCYRFSSLPATSLYPNRRQSVLCLAAPSSCLTLSPSTPQATVPQLSVHLLDLRILSPQRPVHQNPSKALPPAALLLIPPSSESSVRPAQSTGKRRWLVRRWKESLADRGLSQPSIQPWKFDIEATSAS